MNSKLKLSDLVNKAFEPVNKPEPEKRKIQTRPVFEYIAPFETGESYQNIWRMSRSFEFSGPYPAKFDESHNLSHGIGTYNVNMPVPFASYMQELRNGDINPENSEDVEYFQEIAASITTLFFPIIISKILKSQNKENLLDKLDIGIKFEHRITGKPYFFGKNRKQIISYEELFNSNWDQRKTTRVKTIGGSLSEAAVSFGLSDYSPLLKIRGKLGLDLNFIDIQRAGTLPSLAAKWVCSQMGIESYILSTDAKRIHKKDGTDVDHINLVEPKAYNKSEYSFLLNNSFVVPSSYKETDTLVIYDPMLATGKSAKKVIDVFRKNSPNTDIYLVSLFTGGYEAFEELSGLDVNIITLAHDQADLNDKKYIQPGLGDAGDKLSGQSKIVDVSLLNSFAKNIGNSRKGFKEIVENYSFQLTGSF